jgi:hypothetical protein
MVRFWFLQTAAHWTPLEGLYTNPGTGTFQPNGQPLYDGTQTNMGKGRNESFSIYGQPDSAKVFA